MIDIKKTMIEVGLDQVLTYFFKYSFLLGGIHKVLLGKIILSPLYL